MAKLESLDPTTPVFAQLKEKTGPIVLANTFVVPKERTEAFLVPSSTHGQALPGPAFHPGSDARRPGLEDADPAAPSAADCALSASGAVRVPGTMAVAAARPRWDFMFSSNRP
ncbi:hypothetical protein HEK616_35090 [Streptomyces nigrescens]|uniref:Uncharacterized protein n=2 Tax=Streptomyces TaxID=1883 RepID=A0ABM7ZUH1_STRNI|nr:hypothetical protein [Streptomyces nigrescens]MEE4422399.1 hypothetical protein [Streptomyces sp. DSM 41528]BDM70022.1 hypothetical protein HEK616_35090 [Streptomyces nigrescens]